MLASFFMIASNAKRFYAHSRETVVYFALMARLNARQFKRVTTAVPAEG